MPWAALDSTASPLKQAAGLLAFAALVGIFVHRIIPLSAAD
jgi:hypothetical protein